MSNEIIEDIASKHLGKAGDGTRVDPYKTPDMITPDLLVGVPRVLNRTQYEIINIYNTIHCDRFLNRLDTSL